MKIKFKLSNEQFFYLVAYIQNSTYSGLDELAIFNLRLFVPIGLKKIIDIKCDTKPADKIKTFNAEVNQYTAILRLLMNERNFLDSYTLSIFLTLQNQNKSLLSLSV